MSLRLSRLPIPHPSTSTIPRLTPLPITPSMQLPFPSQSSLRLLLSLCRNLLLLLH